MNRASRSRRSPAPSTCHQPGPTNLVARICVQVRLHQSSRRHVLPSTRVIDTRGRLDRVRVQHRLLRDAAVREHRAVQNREGRRAVQRVPAVLYGYRGSYGAQLPLEGGRASLLAHVLVLRDRNRRQDAQDHDDDHQLDQGETSLVPRYRLHDLLRFSIRLTTCDALRLSDEVAWATWERLATFISHVACRTLRARVLLCGLDLHGPDSQTRNTLG